MLAFFCLLAFLFSFHAVEEPNFLGLQIGMKATDALIVAGKKPNVFQTAKPHSGEIVISDTLPISSCSLDMRRSLGFDTSGTLTAVGLTYKTDADHIAQARSCAFDWLKETYGEPTGTAVRDSVLQSVWKFSNAVLTCESRNYNSRDYFVLIYYYKDQP